MSISLKNRSLISISDYSPEEICHVLDIAEDFEKNPHQNLLNGRIIGSLFFEPSTRTRLSFETAIQLLGGNVIGFSSTAGTSIQKGESLADTITMVASYADLIVMRNPIEGSARFASEVSKVRIIQTVQPDEIYNLAAQSHVKVSFDCPEYTAEADAVGTLRLLEAVRILGLEKKTRIYQADLST